MILNYDTLLHVAEYLEAEEEYSSLFQCSLVDKGFNLVASKILYRKIVLKPPPNNTFRLGKENQELTPAWISACLPHNLGHVVELHVAGFLVQRPVPQNNFPDVLCDSIRKWENLHTVEFTPSICHADVFTNALSVLKNCPHLRHITVNRTCCDDIRTPLLIQLERLESLTILNPTRTLLQDLPEWLSRLLPGLKHVRLLDNCGSVTPGVLGSCLTYLRDIHSFALGLSYSVTNDDAFSFLAQLHAMSQLDMRYYLQLRTPSSIPHLASLRSLTVRHAIPATRLDATHLIKWIRRLSARSPLEEIRLIPDPKNRAFPNISFDGLLNHIGLKHGKTLRVLNIAGVFVGLAALVNFCNRCAKLEELAAGTSVDIVNSLCTVLSPCRMLRTVVINTPNIKANKIHISEADIGKTMRSFPRLRRLSLNQVHWEGSWVSKDDGEVVFRVQSVPTPHADTNSN